MNQAILILLLLATFVGWAKPILPREVPLPILHQVDTLCAPKDFIQWSKTDQGYQADFICKGKNMALLFKKNGQLAYRKTELDYQDVPSFLRNRIDKEYHGMKVVFVLQSEGEGTTGYEVLLMAGALLYSVTWDTKEQKIVRYDISKREAENYDYLMKTGE